MKGRLLGIVLQNTSQICEKIILDLLQNFKILDGLIGIRLLRNVSKSVESVESVLLTFSMRLLGGLL